MSVTRACRKRDNRSPSSLRCVFTGIIREKGRVAVVEPSNGGVRIEIEAPATAAMTAVGDSVAIGGVCLTAVEARNGTLAFDAVPETLARTTLADAVPAAEVNVEPALRAGESLGGHYVQGHVDGIGRVRAHEREGDGSRLWVEAPAELLRYCVEKGSIAVDGVSLTVSAIDAAWFEVSLIPETLERTTLGAAAPRRAVNLEVDLIAKYVEKLSA